MWTLEYNNTEKSFAEWGLSDLRRRLVNQNADTVEFRVPDAAIDSDPLFAPESAVIIRRDGVTWFRGIITRTPAQGNAQAEQRRYTVEGPWWHLENLVYQQTWQEVTDFAPALPVLATIEKGRLVLGQGSDGNLIHTGQQITQAAQYAIDQGAPFQLGTIGVAVPIPFDEAKDLSCAEVIRRMLRWSPDAVAWFDYSTTPLPTLHVTRRSAMNTLTIDAGAGDKVSELSLSPRYDLLRPAVVLKYEKTHQTDDNTWTTTQSDIAPADATGREFKAAVMTISLGGRRANYLRQKIEAETVQEDSPTWWRDHLAELEGIPVSNITIHDHSRQSTLDRELVSGQIADWMGRQVEEDVIRATLSWFDDDLHVVKKQVQLRLTVTDATTQTYRKLVSSTPEEPTPSGLAQALYNAASELHYDGSLELTETEAAADWQTGRVLNLTGLRPEWATMRALVQTVETDVDTGRTRLRFGPPEQLGAADLVELLRVNRSREPARSATVRLSGQPDDAPEISNPTHGRLSGGGGGTGRYKKLTFVDPDHEDRKILIDAATLPQTLTMQLREEDVCESGTLKKRYVLASEPYTPAV